MDFNSWQRLGNIEYEDRLRAFSRQKPVYPITVFEIEPGWLRRKTRRLLSALMHGVTRRTAQTKREASSPSLIGAESLRLEP